MSPIHREKTVVNRLSLIPLKISFWPRGRTLVRGWSSDLSSLTEESGETESGIVRPANFTWKLIEEEDDSPAILAF